MEKQIFLKDYQRGFNEGWTITEFMPDLSQTLVNVLPDSARSQGFKDGSNEYILDRAKSIRPKFLDPDRLKDLDKGNDAFRDREIDLDKE